MKSEKEIKAEIRRLNKIKNENAMALSKNQFNSVCDSYSTLKWVLE